jgi:hypothetical protein
MILQEDSRFWGAFGIPVPRILPEAQYRVPKTTLESEIIHRPAAGRPHQPQGPLRHHRSGSR